MSAPVVRARGLGRIYRTLAGDVHALDGVDLDVTPGELLVVRGRSGSGKTTLLSLLGGLDRPTSGTVEVAGRDLGGLDDAQVSELRRETLGYVFQSFGLLPMLSAAENVEVPLRVLRTDPDVRRERVEEVLELVGLAQHRDQRPYELSGGQQQRVALVRALCTGPRLLLLDEITAALDPELVGEVLELVRAEARAGMTMVLATHEMAFAREVATTVCFLHEGRILEQGPPDQVLADPREERTRQFLRRVLPEPPSSL